MRRVQAENQKWSDESQSCNGVRGYFKAMVNLRDFMTSL